jgi:hypothetical protein
MIKGILILIIIGLSSILPQDKWVRSKNKISFLDSLGNIKNTINVQKHKSVFTMMAEGYENRKWKLYNTVERKARWTPNGFGTSAIALITNIKENEISPDSAFFKVTYNSRLQFYSAKGDLLWDDSIFYNFDLPNSPSYWSQLLNMSDTLFQFDDVTISTNEKLIVANTIANRERTDSFQRIYDGNGKLLIQIDRNLLGYNRISSFSHPTISSNGRFVCSVASVPYDKILVCYDSLEEMFSVRKIDIDKKKLKEVQIQSISNDGIVDLDITRIDKYKLDIQKDLLSQY